MTGVATKPPLGSREVTRQELATRHVATGVAVLTCGPADRVEGVTVSTIALASVSPPILSIALREDSRGLRTLLSATTFVVNSLSAQQAPLARHFASRRRASGLDQLPADAWGKASPRGTPLLSEAVAWLECQTSQTLTVGDHRVVFATVLDVTNGDGAPLVSFAGDLHAGFPTPTPTPTATLSERDR
jgi:flavin reductase (DIM6/NTAB) family NADH-FMN oxidoreductase RutF